MSTETTQDTSPVSDTSAVSTSVDTGTSDSAASVAASSGVDNKSIPEKIAEIKAGKEAKADANKAAPVVPAAAAPAYTPNYKYRAAMQEKELDPFWHPLVKDLDSEKKVKEVFTKAEAFEYFKNKHEASEKDLTSVRSDFQNQSQIVNKIVSSLNQKDFDSAFRNLGVPEEDIIRWAAKRVDYLQMMNQLPPEQRAAIERQQNASYEAQVYQEQTQQMQSQFETQASQMRGMQLDINLSRPEINNAAQFWDQKMGQQGAFRDLVIEEGQRAWHVDNVDLSPEQAISRVLQKFGKFLDAQGAVQSGQSSAPMANAQSSPTVSQKPVIPAISGSSKTPVKKQVKSLDDLKALKNAIEERESASL